MNIEEALQKPAKTDGIPKGYLTTEQLAQKLDIHPRSVREKLRKMFLEGRIEVKTAWMTNMTGSRYKAPIYKLKN